jgi:hypothetical protein
VHTARRVSGSDACIVCGKPSRIDFQGDVIAEQWELSGAEFISGAGRPEGEVTLLTGTIDRARPWKVCPAHRRFTGIAILRYQYGQTVRFWVCAATPQPWCVVGLPHD